MQCGITTRWQWAKNGFAYNCCRKCTPANSEGYLYPGHCDCQSNTLPAMQRRLDKAARCCTYRCIHTTRLQKARPVPDFTLTSPLILRLRWDMLSKTTQVRFSHWALRRHRCLLGHPSSNTNVAKSEGTLNHIHNRTVTQLLAVTERSEHSWWGR